MKKRIGSKLYDTETAELITETALGKVYRKRTREREWFLCDEKCIFTPLTNEDAIRLIGELPNSEPESKTIMIRVDRETHNKVSAMAKADGLSITEEMRKIISSY